MSKRNLVLSLAILFCELLLNGCETTPAPVSMTTTTTTTTVKTVTVKKPAAASSFPHQTGTNL